MEDGLLVMTTAGAGGSQTNRVSDAEAEAWFVNAEIRAGRWILTPGVRFEDVDLRRLDYSTADPSRSQGPTRVRGNSTDVLIPGMGVLYRDNEDWRACRTVADNNKEKNKFRGQVRHTRLPPLRVDPVPSRTNGSICWPSHRIYLEEETTIT